MHIFSPPLARRGSLVVTSFIIVIGMALMVGGIHTMLKNQLDQTLTIKDISLAKTQVVYLAEMGVNNLMYIANSNANIGVALPWPMAVSAYADYDFKPYVAMVRGLASPAAANCRLTRTAIHSFRCDATLTVPTVGTFTKRIDFTAAQAAPVWKLTAYQTF